MAEYHLFGALNEEHLRNPKCLHDILILAAKLDEGDHAPQHMFWHKVVGMLQGI